MIWPIIGDSLIKYSNRLAKIMNFFLPMEDLNNFKKRKVFQEIF